MCKSYSSKENVNQKVRGCQEVFIQHLVALKALVRVSGDDAALSHFVGKRAVTPLEIEERLFVSERNVLDLADKYRVVPAMV